MDFRRINWPLNQRLCLAFFLLALITPVVALEVNSLYEFEVPIANELGAETPQAKLIEQAFQGVLIRAAGSEKVLHEAEVIAAQSDLDKYVTRFSYQQYSAFARSIKVLFNETQIKQLLKKTHFPVWEKNRPLVLVYLVLNQENNPQWISLDNEQETGKELDKTFKERGIPLHFPLYDLTDNNSISEQEVLDMAFTPIEAAANRYKPDAILVGSLQQQENQWQAEWTLLKAGKKNKWQDKAASIPLLFSQTTEILVPKLRSGPHVPLITVRDDPKELPKESVASSNAPQITVSIAGINNAELYAKVLAYLQKLPTVTAVEVMQIMPEKTQFTLQTHSNQQEIKAAIAQEKLLINSDANSDKELFYKMSEQPIIINPEEQSL